MNKLKILNNKRLLLLLSFAFFVFMMVFNLGHSSLWGDEWVEYTISQKSLLTSDFYDSVAETFQPPLYNILMHFWLKLSDNVLWFRLFNVLLGCITYLSLYRTLKTLINRNIAMLVPCILAVTYQWIYCIQECSEYTLMLCCLFGAVMFYVECSNKFAYLKLFGFIMCNVLAIYSQYGSVFIVSPLLIIFFFENICNKEVEKKRKIIITASYIASFVVFTIPLFYFLKTQLGNNAISSHIIMPTEDALRDFPFIFGQVIAYFFNVNSGEYWPIIFGILGFIFMLISIFLLQNKNIAQVKKSLVITLLIGYAVSYFLVVMHIYAMIHPNQSAGFFYRYSYFYIPICAVTIPVVTDELVKMLNNKSIKNHMLKHMIAASAVVVLALSSVSILKNWDKSLDKQFAKIWMDNEGWKTVTLLYGTAPYGFNYYISHSDGYQEGYLNKSTAMVDDDNLPSEFWAWRTNWGGEGWQTTIEKAKEKGYTVIVYNDSGEIGQLAYCYLE